MDLRTEIEIDASPEAVWAVLTDWRSYPRWNPYIASARGQLARGADLRVTLSLLDGSETKLHPRITVVSEARELRWRADRWLRAFLSIEHRFLLEPKEKRRTRLEHGQTVSGSLKNSLGPDVTLTMRGMVHMNLALKERVEELAKR